MRSARVVAALSIAMTVVAAGVASAGDFPPKVGVTKIVINQQIGAVKLGMSYKQAIKGWGEQGTCKLGEPDTDCFWDDDHSFSSLRFKGGKVETIIIQADKGDNGAFVREFRTDQGIRIGSLHRAVHAAFRQSPPDGKVKLTKPADSVTKAGRSTNFIYTGERLTTISMYG